MEIAPLTTTRNEPGVTTNNHYVTILFGVWLVCGIFIDGYAHNHGAVETFFTPWHAILYSGFLGAAIWMSWLVYRTKQATGQTWSASVPQGYGWGLIGVGIFLLGGIGDMLWHVIFGIEENISALLSPTHLMLLVGGVLIVFSPFRAEWHKAEQKAPGWRAFTPPFLSVTIAAAAANFFLMYAWMFRHNFPEQSVIERYQVNYSSIYISELIEERGLVYILLNTVFYMFPVFMLMKRWKLPLGTITALFTIITALMSSLDGFTNYFSVILAFVTGVVGDMLYRWLRPAEGRLWAVRVFSAAVPVLLWGLYFIAMDIFYTIGWEIELWTGSVVEAGLLSLALSYLAISPKQNISP